MEKIGMLNPVEEKERGLEGPEGYALPAIKDRQSVRDPANSSVQKDQEEFLVVLFRETTKKKLIPPSSEYLLILNIFSPFL